MQNGITLIALVISIIVMLILAGVSINAIIGENGILKRTQLAGVISKFAGYKEQLELNAFDDEVYASGAAVKNYIPTITAEDIDKFVIMGNKLIYTGDNELEFEAVSNLGIENAMKGEDSTKNAINEIKAIIGTVLELGNNFNIPTDDSLGLENTDNLSDANGLIGTRLFDRNGLNLNNRSWNIVIEYSKDNSETGRYGSRLLLVEKRKYIYYR